MGDQRVVLCLPTGSGKTVVFSDITAKAANKEKKVLLLTDRIELFKQTMKALEMTGIPIEIVHAKSKYIQTQASVMIGMIETVKRRWDKAIKQRDGGLLYKWKSGEPDWRYILDWKPDLVVIDEAHKGNFTKIFEIWPDVRVIGATATPVGKHFPKYYQSIVQTIDVPDLIMEGWLCPVKAFQMKEFSPDMSGVKTTGNDYNDKQMFGQFDDAKLYAGVVEKYNEMAAGRKTMVFCVNIEHSIKTWEEFAGAGLPAFVVHSNMNKEEREFNIRSFESSPNGIMVNCGILTTGYDHPPVKCIILNRATQSLPLFLQMIGRGSRLSEATGKREFIVLDFGENHTRHGSWDDERTWTLQVRKKKKGAAPMRSCEGCDAMLPAMLLKCPYCGEEKVLTEKEVEELLKQGVMVPVSSVMPKILGKKVSEISVEELVELENLKRYKPSFIWRIMRNRGKEELLRYYKIKSHKAGWLNRQLALISEGDTDVFEVTITDNQIPN